MRSSTVRRRISREISRLTASLLAQTSMLACSFLRPRTAVVPTNSSAPNTDSAMRMAGRRENIGVSICTSIITAVSRRM